jgi:hypothetical protein
MTINESDKSTKNSVTHNGTKISVGDILVRSGTDNDTLTFKYDTGYVFYVKMISDGGPFNGMNVQNVAILMLMNPKDKSGSGKHERTIITKRYIDIEMLVDKINSGIYKHYPVKCDGEEKDEK